MIANTTSAPIATNEVGTPLTCPQCGHISTPSQPVGFYTVWVGGQGYVEQARCQNVVECDARYNSAHGFGYDASGDLVKVG